MSDLAKKIPPKGTLTILKNSKQCPDQSTRLLQEHEEKR
jgi:hypothetical protein